jgi:hypothetical protein
LPPSAFMDFPRFSSELNGNGALVGGKRLWQKGPLGVEFKDRYFLLRQPEVPNIVVTAVSLSILEPQTQGSRLKAEAPRYQRGDGIQISRDGKYEGSRRIKEEIKADQGGSRRINAWPCSYQIPERRSNCQMSPSPENCSPSLSHPL